MIGGISSASILAQTIAALNTEQATMADMTQQLSTGVRSNDLTRYTPAEASSLIDIKGLITKYDSYKAAILSVQPRMSVYSSSLAALEKIGNTAQGLINGAQNYASALDTGLPQQLASALDQVSYYLNQKVGERYIYSGTRYQTKPVADLRALPLPPSGTFPVVSPNLPPYDTQAPGTDVNAFTQDRVAIDDNLHLDYGIPSTSTGLQNLIQGLRYAYAASQDSANYDSYMAQAKQYLTASTTDIRSLQAKVAGDQKVLNQTTKDHNATLALLRGRQESIQNIDINEVATKISFYQTQLQASYAATGKLASLSILNFLPNL
ncbi:MAG: flagellin [Alphaproteobacteria bacterium]